MAWITITSSLTETLMSKIDRYILLETNSLGDSSSDKYGKIIAIETDSKKEEIRDRIITMKGYFFVWSQKTQIRLMILLYSHRFKG